MLYLFIILILACVVICTKKKYDVYYYPSSDKELFKKSKRHLCLAIILLIFFIVSAIVGTVIACNSDFLSITTEESSDTYQVTEFSALKSKNNLFFDGDYETNYSIIIEDNFLIRISSKDSDTEIICDSYNPTRVTIEEEHYFKWWFLCPYDTYTYKLS